MLPVVDMSKVPGWEGSQGPFKAQYNEPHVYARDVHSGAGNCVCGRAPEERLHVPVPSAPTGGWRPDSDGLTSVAARDFHARLQAINPEHDQGGCWCCCWDCDFDAEAVWAADRAAGVESVV